MLKSFFIFVKLFFILEIFYVLFIFIIELVRICLHNHALEKEEQEMLSRRILFEIRTLKKKNLNINLNYFDIFVFFCYYKSSIFINLLLLYI